MNISELTLPELNITSPEFAEDPFPPYEKAIEQHWLARAAVGYVVLGFNDMRELLLMDDKLDTPNKAITTLMGADDSIWGKWNNRFMLALSGDDHKRIRGLVAPTFTPRNAELHRGSMSTNKREELESAIHASRRSAHPASPIQGSGGCRRRRRSGT